MKYILTEEEYKNLAGDKQKIEALYQKLLDQAIADFRLKLSNLIAQYGNFESRYRSPDTDRIINIIKQAMKEAKLTEPKNPSSPESPSV